jgi:uncharacterized membrane protein
MSNEISEAEIKKLTYVVYILQALSFVFLITAVAGIIINYIKQDDVKGSWLESHFEWQKRTFWYGLLWMALAALSFFLLIQWVIFPIVAVWLVYRIAKGWVYLVDGKELYK